MTDTLRPLPILLSEGGIPSGWALEALRQAKLASGYQGLIRPAVALEGSPAPILAVGCRPKWLTKYVYVDTLFDVEATTAALRAILIEEDDSVLGDEDLLSRWFKGPVKLIGEEEYAPVRSELGRDAPRFNAD